MNDPIRWTRIRAFLTHISASATVVSVVTATVFFIWYPWPYWYANAADKILLMLVAVDVFIGPTLTLIVFKPGKPGLKMDMTAIITVQIAALTYGIITLYQARPMFTVYAVDRFEVVTASDIELGKIKHAQLLDLPFAGPGFAYAKPPSDRAAAQKILTEVLFHRAPDIERRPELYEPYSSHKETVLSRAKAIDVSHMNSGEKFKLDAFLNEQNAQQDDFIYFPLVGKDPDRNMLLVVNKISALPVTGLAIDPWGIRKATPKAKKK